MRLNLKAYKQVNLHSNLLESNPHQVILMMLDGALQSISVAKGAIERKNFELKSESITKATNILDALRGSLDFECEPKVSENFDVLYSYCIETLNKVSLDLNISAIDEIVDMLKPLRDAWAEMSEESKKEGTSLLAEKHKLAEGA
jgi:flagellar protein FliS